MSDHQTSYYLLRTAAARVRTHNRNSRRRNFLEKIIAIAPSFSTIITSNTAATTSSHIIIIRRRRRRRSITL
jgi:hypothetical protein